MATHSIRRNSAKKPSKPRPDFPLFPHATGYWAKKVRSKLVYFGKVANDPQGEAALNLWLDQKDELLAGRTPRSTPDGLTVRHLCNHFLTVKEQQRDSGELAHVTYADYYRTCSVLVGAFGKTRQVEDLAADDFQALRNRLANQYGIHRLGNTIQRVRSVFKYAHEAGLIDRPVRFGPMFKQPSTRHKRLHRQKQGQRMFEAAQLRTIIENAEQPLEAMILLGINCGFGNSDCGKLPLSAIDFENGWVNFPRPKTAVERRCPLWPETLAAIQEAIASRPAPKDDSHTDLVFVTKYGQAWWKEQEDNPVAKEFRKLLDAIDVAAAKAAEKRRAKPPTKIYRRGLGFYALRHTFETVGGESRDQVAVNHIMGHADNTMAGVYRERISDERLRDVVDLVRTWLFPNKRAK
jgi:integrase